MILPDTYKHNRWTNCKLKFHHVAFSAIYKVDENEGLQTASDLEKVKLPHI